MAERSVRGWLVGDGSDCVRLTSHRLGLNHKRFGRLSLGDLTMRRRRCGHLM
jgi:hypothetical protein